MQQTKNGNRPSFKSLADYAGERYAPAFEAAGWREHWLSGKRNAGLALCFETDTGTRYRLIGGQSSKFFSVMNYTACWYRLSEAVKLAQQHNRPLVLCNGESSTVTAQFEGIPATAITNGEGSHAARLRDGLLDTLLASYKGDVWLAYDCDAEGHKAGNAVAQVLADAGYSVKVINLGGSDKFDLRDFTRKHEADAPIKLAELAAGTPPYTPAVPNGVGTAITPASANGVATAAAGDEQAQRWAQAMARGNANAPDRPSYEKVQAACAAINPHRWDVYSEWIGLGMSLHSWDRDSGLQLWEKHSRSSDKYREGECERKWRSFRSSGYSIATVLGCANADDPTWFDRFLESERAAAATNAAQAVRATLHLDQPAAPQAQAVPAPVPTHKRKPCPVDVLPASVRTFCERVAAATETPIELSVMLALTTLATAVQRRVSVSVRAGWREQLTLFTITVLPSGEGKSPVFQHITQPIRTIESEMISQWKEEKKTFDALCKDEQRESPLPAMPRLVTSDTTSEKLALLLRDQGERMAVMSAEGGVLDIVSGRYSPVGMAGGLDVYLHAWNGEAMTVDRSKSESFRLDHPCLSIGLAVQPTTLERLANVDYLRDRGFLARFLVVIPEPKLGTRLHPDTIPVVDDWHASQWEALIRQLWDVQDDTVLKLTQEGFVLIQEFARELEPRLNDDLAQIQAAVGKVKSQIVRVAGLLKLAGDPRLSDGPDLTGEHIAPAIKFYRWVLDHQIAAQRLTSEVAPVARAIGKIAAWVTRFPKNATITLRQAQRGTHVKRETLIEALASLDEIGLIKAVETTRRDSRWYEVSDPDAIKTYANRLAQEMRA